MSGANLLPSEDLDLIWSGQRVWNTIWGANTNLYTKAEASVVLGAGVLNGTELIQVNCIDPNTDAQGGSGSGTDRIKRQIALPVSVVEIDSVVGRVDFIRQGLIGSAELQTRVGAVGGVAGEVVASDDIDGSASYVITIYRKRN